MQLTIGNIIWKKKGNKQLYIYIYWFNDKFTSLRLNKIDLTSC